MAKLLKQSLKCGKWTSSCARLISRLLDLDMDIGTFAAVLRRMNVWESLLSWYYSLDPTSPTQLLQGKSSLATAFWWRLTAVGGVGVNAILVPELFLFQAQQDCP